MTVKPFVSRDDQGRLWPPDHEHEAQASEQIISKLWTAFHHCPDFYAVAVNLHEPNADMVILTERGLGVVELKHYPGTISILPSGAWCANGRVIQSGAYPNPHHQVQAYATMIRRKVLQFIVPAAIRQDLSQSDRFKFQTTVCFTHPDARIGTITKTLRHTKCLPWEKSFSVTTPARIPAWAFRLRFEVDMGREQHFEPYCLSPKTIIHVITQSMGCSEWKEILDLMPMGKPYAYLQLVENGEVAQTYNLHKDETIIGRSPDKSHVVIPDRFAQVSRTHACIVRLPDKIVIRDLDSKHGTFVNGAGISEQHSLLHGDMIVLGGKIPGVKPCLLKYLLTTQSVLKAGTTY